MTFWNYRDELVVNQGIILKGTRVVVPPSMPHEILQRLHVSHLGITKTKQHARTVIFWPGITKNITSYISQCDACNAFHDKQQQEPLICSEIPKLPWEHIAIDIFDWQNCQYLITVNYYSQFFELDKLHSLTSSAIIVKLKSQFSCHGIPKLLTSDNTSNFLSSEFEQFAKLWDFSHKTSSPKYPQANGLVEKTVQTAKKLMSKALEDKLDPYLAILEYQNTPIDDGHHSPAELLMSCQLRSALLVTSSQLEPKIVPNLSFEFNRQKKQGIQKSYHDQTAKSLTALKEGQPVWVKLSDKKEVGKSIANQSFWRCSLLISGEDSKWLNLSEEPTTHQAPNESK